MKPSRAVLPLLLAAAFAFGAARSHGGSFSTAPAKVFLDADRKSAVLKVSNDGEEKLTIQANVVKWAQDEKGNEQFLETEEIVFFPRIMTLEKGEEKSLRIGFETKGSVDVEKTYRLFLRELPVVKPGEKALKVALRLAVPVFISPKKKGPKLAMDGVGVAEGKVVVTVKNSGNSHGLVEKLNVAGTDETGAAVFKKETSGWYVLAGSRKTFSVDIFEEECRKTRSIRVTVKPEGLGAMEATAKVDGANCEKAPERSGTKRPDEEKGD